MPYKNYILALLVVMPMLASSQVVKFMARYDVNQVDSINDSTFLLYGYIIDVTGSYTALDIDTNDKVIMRGWNSSGKVIYDRYKVVGISEQDANKANLYVVSDYIAGIQDADGWPNTGTFPIASPTADTSLLTYRTSFYLNLIDPDYDAALDNLNLQYSSGAIGDGLWDSDGQDIYNLNAGNVGVGTISPATKLDVDGVITATGGNSTQWNEAYSWGNHAAAGYLTTVTVSETDPVFAVSAAASVTTTTIANWNEAYSWGDHSLEGYLKSITWPETYTPTAHTQDWNTILNVPTTYTPTTHNHDHDALTNYVSAKHFYQKVIDTVNTGLSGLLKATSGKLSAITDNSANWNTAYGWGNHASAGYLTSITWPATYTPTAHTQDWNTILNAPATYTPTTHTHDDRYYTETEIGNFFSGSTPITGYNKTTWDALVTFPGFGTTSTTCAYGNHLHTGVYLPVASYKWGLQGSANSDGTYDIYNSNDGNVRIGTTSLVQPGFGKLYVTTTRTGTSNYAIYATATGAGTSNYGGFFDAWGATNNYALITGTNGDVKLQCPKFYLTAIGNTTSKTRGLVMDDATGQVYYQTLPAAFSYPGAGIVVSTGSAWGTSITDNSSNWNTAYGWGNHASVGYLTSITWPATYTPTAHTQDWTTILNVPTTYTPTTHNHDHDALTNYVAAKHFYQKAIDTVNTGLSGLLKATSGKLSAITDNSANWNTAYGWGNHAGLYDLAGVALSYLNGHLGAYAHGNIANGQTAYGWGNHASQNYATTGGTLTSNYVVKATGASSIANSQIRDDGTNVGIGVTPSTYKFRVAGTLFAENAIYIEPQSGGVDNFLSLKTTGTGGKSMLLLESTAKWTYQQNTVGASGSTQGTWTIGNYGDYNYIVKYKTKTSSIDLDTLGTVTLPKIKLTPEGGYAVSMIAGCTLEQGDIVSMCMEGAAEVVTKTFADSTYGYVVGVAYSSAATGTTVWVVTSGRALVKFSSISCSSGNVTNAPTKGYYASAGKSNCDVSPYSVCWEAGKANAHLSGTCNNRLGIITETKSGGSSAYVLLNILNNVFY